MKYLKSSQLFAAALVAALLLGTFATLAFSQARRQPPAANQKKNKRPSETVQPGEKQQEEPLPPDLTGKPQEAEKVTISTQIVNVDTVVYHKKSGQIVTGLKKENFALFSDGNPQVITNFSTPEAPITVVMVLEYSKWSEMFGYYGSGGYDPVLMRYFVQPPCFCRSLLSRLMITFRWLLTTCAPRL